MSMNTYNDLMIKAQGIISEAEDQYLRMRCLHFGEITPEMEAQWMEAMRRAEQIQAEAARELEYEMRDLDHQDDLQTQSELRRG